LGVRRTVAGGADPSGTVGAFLASALELIPSIVRWYWFFQQDG